MSLEDFDYECPEHLIAQEPLKDRSSCKLMHLNDKAEIHHHTFSELIHLIPKNALLLLNDTKVQHARIPILRKSGAQGEMLIQQADPMGSYIAMGRPSKRLKVGERVICKKNHTYEIELLEQLEGGNWRLDLHPPINHPQELDIVGEIPLPPYIQRPDGPSENDNELYQTVFAKQIGSAAAPTASLHFTEELLEQLKSKGIQIETLTLHVGSGTFLPIRSESIEDHIMHKEIYDISQHCALEILKAKSEKRPIVAVGTTVVRAVESAANEILKGLSAQNETRLFIKPSYDFKIIDELITNFHLPKSTLLMLVASFCGSENLMKAYQNAIKNDYRFFSYGDAMYLKRVIHS